jgi:hypothetical protein
MAERGQLGPRAGSVERGLVLAEDQQLVVVPGIAGQLEIALRELLDLRDLGALDRATQVEFVVDLFLESGQLAQLVMHQLVPDQLITEKNRLGHAFGRLLADLVEDDDQKQGNESDDDCGKDGNSLADVHDADLLRQEAYRPRQRVIDYKKMTIA